MTHELTNALEHFSQGEEDEIIWDLLAQLGMPADRGYFLEIGVGDGTQNNTRSLAERGWWGSWIGNEPLAIHPLPVTFYQIQVELDNVDTLPLPLICHLFSLDIDGNDYWIAEKLVPRLQPKILVVEYNAHAEPHWIMPYTPNYKWKQGMPFGASLPAWKKLLEPMGYTYHCHTRKQVNAFFVRSA